MEDSAFEAIYTGVYIFIFIAALTTTLYMFRNVNELAENSYKYGMQIEEQSLIESPEEVEYILTGSDVISYFFNNTYKDSYDSNDEINTNFVIEYEDEKLNAKKKLSYVNLEKDIDLSAKYNIMCTSIDDEGKYHFTIKKKS